MNSSRTYEVARGECEAIVRAALSAPFITSGRNIRNRVHPYITVLYGILRSGNLMQSRPAGLMNTR